jgi:ParB family chromosome partitioning protein
MHAPIEEVFPNRRQPRTRFDDALLEQLAASIREMGVLEPILVRRRSAGGFEIIAGERRWRAAQKAGLREVPIHVRELTEQAAFEAALVENLQREDLNPVETARAFERLVREHAHTQDTIAKRVGKDRSTVSNALRLLKLPEAVLALVETGELSEGHGRALLGAGETGAMLRLAKQAAAEALSVRDVERRARSIAAAARPGSKATTKGKPPSSANVRDLESRLARRLGTRVSVADRKGKGHLTIPFSSYDELDRILALLGV